MRRIKGYGGRLLVYLCFRVANIIRRQEVPRTETLIGKRTCLYRSSERGDAGRNDKLCLSTELIPADFDSAVKYVAVVERGREYGKKVRLGKNEEQSATLPAAQIFLSGLIRMKTS